MQLKKEHIILIIIIAMAAFIRFYRLPDMANFDFDQQYASNFAYAVLKEYPLQLVGQGLSVEGLFMGPLYFYYLVPFFALFNLHPLGGFVGSAILGIINILIFYFVAKSLFGKTAGLLAAFLQAFLFPSINADWTMVPAYSSDGVILLTWWYFYKYWHEDTKVLPLLGFLFGLYTSIHPILFPLYIIFLVLLLIKRIIPSMKTITASLMAMLIPLSPLILFEYWHSFLEVRKLFEIFTGGNSSTAESASWSRLYNHLDLALTLPYSILNINLIPELIFSIVLIIIIIYQITKKINFWNDSFHLVVLPLTFIIVIGYYTIFPTHVPEYYFKILYTLSLLYIAAILGILLQKRIISYLVYLFIFIVTFSNFQSLQEKWSNPSLITLAHKDYIVKQILMKQPKDQEFYVSYIKSPGWNFGFDYLFKSYGQIPQTRQAIQPIYTIVIPKALSPDSIDISSGNVGLILPDEK